MASILDTVRNALATGTPGIGQANQAFNAASAAQNNAQLKSYQDKYGPTVGQRLYQQDQTKSAAPAQAAGQGHMGGWADKLHPTSR